MEPATHQQIQEHYQRAGALHSLLSPLAWWDSQTFLTKDGSLGQILRVASMEYETADDEKVDLTAQRFAAAVRDLGEDYRIYQHVVKRNRPTIPHDECGNSVAREAVKARKQFLDSKADELFSREAFLTVLRETNSMSLRRAALHPHAFSARSISKDVRLQLNHARDQLTMKTKTLANVLADSTASEVLDKREGMRFFRRLMNFLPILGESTILAHDFLLDLQIGLTDIECYPDHLRLRDQYVKVLTLKLLPAHTHSVQLRRLLELPVNYILTSEWKPVPESRMRREIESRRRHWRHMLGSFLGALSGSRSAPTEELKDEGAASLLAELGDAQRALETGHSFGEYSLTVVLFAPELRAVEDAMVRCIGQAASEDMILHEESYNLLGAFLATVPGNTAHNVRRLFLASDNAADMNLLYGGDRGSATCPHLGREYLAVVETAQKEPFFLNLHVDDVAHTLLTGKTGSGKTFTVSFLLTALQKYEPVIFVLDLMGGYQGITNLMGGSTFQMGMRDSSFRINPFCLPESPDTEHFLFSFVRVLLETSGDALAPEDERDLYKQIQNVYHIDASQRRLLTLASMLNQRLSMALEKWVEGGQYGHIFDNPVDNLTLKDFQYFDFRAMEDYPDVLEPILFYLLHRASVIVRDANRRPQLKVLIVDEAWRFLKNPTIRAYVAEALRTWRQRNGLVILATQSLNDVSESGMLDLVMSMCPTQIFLQNPIDENSRTQFRLNVAEAKTISGLARGSFLLKTPNGSRILKLEVDAKSRWLYTSNAAEVTRRQALVAQHGLPVALEILAGENRTA